VILVVTIQANNSVKAINFITTFLLLYLLVGCQNPQVNQVTPQSTPATTFAVQPNTPLIDSLQSTGNRAGNSHSATQASPVQVPDSRMPFVEDPFDGCAKETVRDIEVFRQLKNGMYFWELCRIVGKPDKDVGSGIYVYVYRMSDGSEVMVTFANPYCPVEIALP
jgi:hypothetical protein